MEIRRRAALMAVVAVIATVIAGTYLWSFSETGSGVTLLIGVVLGVIAVGHGLAFSDARTPLLVADQTGLRIRLGSAWTGVPWNEIERVEVDERGKVTDGHVAVLLCDHVDVLSGTSMRTRFAAALNRWLYDAPLVVPYGLTTAVSSQDLPAALGELALGRTPVVLVEQVEEPAPTVELTNSATEPGEPADQAEQPDPAESAESAEPAEPAEPDEAPGDLGEQPEPAEPTRKPRRGWIAARTAEVAQPVARPVARAASALSSFPARREEVTMPARPKPATMGTLALSQDFAEQETEPLPEISHLRRRSDDIDPDDDLDHDELDGDDLDGDDLDGHDLDGDREGAGRYAAGVRPDGNVSLIIDATTDLSARAMSKVRRPAVARIGDPADPDVAGALDDASTEAPAQASAQASVEPAGHYIGRDLVAARERLGLSVDEVAARTRIRPFVIESIEVDDFGPCGGDFYARGHLRMLARVLGLDDAPLIATYDEHFASSPIDPRAVFDAELATSSGGLVRGGRASGANWGGLIAAVLVLLLIWGLARFMTASQQLGQTVQPSQTAASDSSPHGSASAGPEPAARSGPVAKAHVKLTATGAGSTVVVRNGNGKVIFRRTLNPGQAVKVEGVPPLQVRASDGSAISLSVRGHRLGTLGHTGAPAHKAVRASGQVAAH